MASDQTAKPTNATNPHTLPALESSTTEMIPSTPRTATRIPTLGLVSPASSVRSPDEFVDAEWELFRRLELGETRIPNK